ncbi:MAG: hypothetical protein ACKVOE_04315 [Rickettsiales bacterium]
MTANTLSFFSNYEKKDSVQFPKFSGTQVLMMPIIIGDLSSVPDSLSHYKPLLSELFKMQKHHGEVGYLTIDEKKVLKGKSQRRKGMHIDGMEPRNFPEFFAPHEVISASGSWAAPAYDDGMGNIGHSSAYRRAEPVPEYRDPEKIRRVKELEALPYDERPLVVKIESLKEKIGSVRRKTANKLKTAEENVSREIDEANKTNKEQTREEARRIKELERQLKELKQYEELKAERDALAKKQNRESEPDALSQEEIIKTRQTILNDIEEAKRRKTELEEEVKKIPGDITEKHKPTIEEIEKSGQGEIAPLQGELEQTTDELARIRRGKIERSELEKIDGTLDEQTRKWRDRNKPSSDRGPGNGGIREASPYTSGVGNGMLLVSSLPGCRVWKQWFDGVPGLNGECDHLREQIHEGTSEILAPNMVYWLDPFCIHESMEQPEDTERQLLRLSLPSKCGWNESCTPNPLGIKPTGKILPYRSEFMVDANYQ